MPKKHETEDRNPSLCLLIYSSILYLPPPFLSLPSSFQQPLHTKKKTILPFLLLFTKFLFSFLSLCELAFSSFLFSRALWAARRFDKISLRLLRGESGQFWQSDRKNWWASAHANVSEWNRRGVWKQLFSFFWSLGVRIIKCGRIINITVKLFFHVDLEKDRNRATGGKKIKSSFRRFHSFARRQGSEGESAEKKRLLRLVNLKTYIVVSCWPAGVQLHVELSLFPGQLVILGLLLPR